jgi:hypothetical protein
MLSFRQITSLIWSLSAFVLAAALALHLRYRPLAEEPAYLDTWTGSVRGTAVAPVPDRAGPARRWSRSERSTEVPEAILRLEGRRIQLVTPRSGPCVRFAFPAPSSRH